MLTPPRLTKSETERAKVIGCEEKNEWYSPTPICKIVKVQNGWIVHAGEQIVSEAQLFCTTHELCNLLNAYANGKVTQCCMCNNIRIEGGEI